MNLLITGSLEPRDDVPYWLDRWLARYGTPELVIMKEARGVASQALRWALDTVGYSRCYLERHCWSDDELAEHRRNQRMVDRAGHGAWCVALPTAKGFDTWDCCNRAWRAGLKVASCPLGQVGNPIMYRPLRLVSA